MFNKLLTLYHERMVGGQGKVIMNAKYSPRLFGIAPYVPDIPFLTTEELWKACGGNTGNMLFSYSLSRMFDTGVTSLPWSAPIESCGEEILVMPLANQLGPHVNLDKLAGKIGDVPCPIVGVGLGAQGPVDGVNPATIPEGSWRWLRALISKAPVPGTPNLAVRGELTRQAIAAKGMGDSCVITGCPSNFLNPNPMLGREISRRAINGIARVAVAAGNPHLRQFSALEQSLVELVQLTDGCYVCQHPLDLFRLSRGDIENIPSDMFKLYRSYTLPRLSVDDVVEWYRVYSRTFFDVPSWLDHMTHYDVVVGTRIHGVMAGIQAGVPGVCLYIDSRTKELCETMYIPCAPALDYVEGISLKDIGKILARWNYRAFDEGRFKLSHTFQEFIESNMLQMHGALKTISRARGAHIEKRRRKVSDPATHQHSIASFSNRYTRLFDGLSSAVGHRARRILSFGCADGYETQELAEIHFPSATVIGCDVDADALQIARKYNRFPGRVAIIHSSEQNLVEHGPYDLILCMSVLCRWPDTRDMENIKELYPFSRFAETVVFLAGLLAPGGVICVYNANYRVSEVIDSSRLAPIALEGVPRSQEVVIFEPDGGRSASQAVDVIAYQRI